MESVQRLGQPARSGSGTRVVKRAAGRAYQRLRGAHPRRPKTKTSALAAIGCDLILLLAAAGMLGGLVVMVWAMLTGVQPVRFIAGAALIALGASLLLLWERVAWEPFARELGQTLDELT